MATALAAKPHGSSIEVASGFSNMQTIVESIRTPEDAKDAIANLKTLEDLLKSLDEFDKQIAKYVALEIETYRRINSLGFASQLKKDSQRRIAKWVGSLSDSEIDDLILRCKVGGIDLYSFFTNRIRPNQIYDETVSRCGESRKQALKDYRACGVINLNNYFFVSDGRKSEECRMVISSVKNTTHNDLLRIGAVGVGDGKYVNPKTDIGREQISNAIRKRADSIIADLKRYIQLTDMASGDFEQNERMKLVARITGAFEEQLQKVNVPEGRVANG